MKIVSSTNIDLKPYGKTYGGNLYCIHVQISDVESRAKEIIKAISDSSWLSKLDIVEQLSYDARAKETVNKLVGQIFEKVEDEVTVEFGEYLVSESARESLKNKHNHTIVPLAELWKEKKTGNPGFDFHTESETNLIAFGEAKYSSSINPHTVAMKQIVSFIGKKKDIMELVDLRYFVSKKSIRNATKNQKAFVAAFSLNSKNYNKIFENAITSKFIDPLLAYPELYLIGIEVCL